MATAEVVVAIMTLENSSVHVHVQYLVVCLLSRLRLGLCDKSL